MRWYYKWRTRLVSLFKRSNRDDELAQEIEQHVELVAAEYETEGLPPDAARKKALKEFGNVEALKEECRESWGMRVVNDLIRDFCYSIRSLWKSKGFSFVVVTTLALCVGANTAILSALYHFVWKPLPFKDADRLVHIYNFDNRVTEEFPIEPLFDPVEQESPYSLNPTGLASAGQYRDYKEQADLFDGFAFVNSHHALLDFGNGGRLTDGMIVSPEFFDLLGAQPVIGRFFQEPEGDERGSGLMVLTESVWENEFNRDPGILGKSVISDGYGNFTIIGVAPREMEVFEHDTKYFIPFNIGTSRGVNAVGGRIYVGALWGKLKDGVGIQAATAQLQTIEQQFLESDRLQRIDHKKHFLAIGHRPEIGRAAPYKKTLYLMQLGAGCVLLAGLVNVILLLLSRAGAKVIELSVRHALGASMWALARLLLLESFILTMVAVVTGLLLALSGVKFANIFLSKINPKLSPITLDQPMLVSVILISMFLVFLMSLASLVGIWKAGKIQRIDSGQRDVSGRTILSGFNSALVIIQVAASFILILGAGLIFKSLAKLLDVNPGFDADHIVQVDMFMMDWSGYEKKEARFTLKEEIISALNELPGVDSVSTASRNPLFPPGVIYSYMIEGIDYQANNDPLPTAIPLMVNKNFFETMGISILEGDTFYGESGNGDIILEKGFVDQYYGDRPALGSRLYAHQFSGNRTADPKFKRFPLRVIGIVDTATFRGLEERDGLPIVYYESARSSNYNILMKTNRTAESLTNEIRAKLLGVSEHIFLFDVRTVKTALNKMHLDRQLGTYLIGGFATLALLLSGVGLYGMLAYNVLQRRREIGVRIALGATSGKVLAMVVKQGLSRVIIGLGIGLVGSLYVTRFIQGMLFDVETTDLWTYAVVLTVFLTVTLSASYLPARRAVRMNPVEALRAE